MDTITKPLIDLNIDGDGKDNSTCEKKSEDKSSRGTATTSLEGKSSYVKSHRKIVIAVDASAHSERALRWYLHHFHRPGDSLFLFHSVEFPNLPVLGSGEIFYKEALDEVIREKHTDIRKLTTKFEEIIKEDNLSATFHARDGESPGHNIVHYAREKDADCIVIGSRGLGSIRRTILGSVSDYVIHHAKMPVIVVPPVHY